MKKVNFLVACLSILSGTALAANVYLDDFSSYSTGTKPDNFTTIWANPTNYNGGTPDSGTANAPYWNISGSTFQLWVKNGYYAGNNRMSSYVNGNTLVGIGGNTQHDFSVLSDFTLVGGAISGNNYRIGLTAFADTSVTSSNGIWGFVSTNGALGFAAANRNDGNFALPSSLTLVDQVNFAYALSAGSIFSASLTGEYVGSLLTLTYTITQIGGNAGDLNIGTTAYITATANASALTGSYFGYTVHDAPTGASDPNGLTLQFDNFGLYDYVVAIPEPSTYMLFFVGFVTLLFLRKRALRKPEIY
jgi:hypothetical protein